MYLGVKPSLSIFSPKNPEASPLWPIIPPRDALVQAMVVTDATRTSSDYERP
jgi:hypothetical protein